MLDMYSWMLITSIILDCLLNSVTLCRDLYRDVFFETIKQRDEMIRFCPSDDTDLLRMKCSLRFVMIGKETLFSVIQVLKQATMLKLNFAFDMKIRIGTDFRLILVESKFIQKFMEIMLHMWKK